MRSVASQGLRALCELDLAHLGGEVINRVVRQSFMGSQDPFYTVHAHGSICTDAITWVFGWE